MTSQTAREAAQNLRDYQRQLDADGTFVGVSRQALDEVLEAFARIEAEALARGRLEGAKAMQEAVILKLDECCEPCFQCNQNVTALDPTAIERHEYRKNMRSPTLMNWSGYWRRQRRGCGMPIVSRCGSLMRNRFAIVTATF